MTDTAAPERTADTAQTVVVEIVHGRGGDCLCINDQRVAGPKPWGGGTVTKRFAVPVSELQLVIDRASSDTRTK
jgi:hypothetical protein